MLVAQCVALLVGPHTKLSNGLSNQERDGVTNSPEHHFHARVTAAQRPQELSGKPFQTGDRIICGRNQHRLGITNGTAATIMSVDVDERSMTVRTDKGAAITLRAGYLDAGHVQHGYATTIHKAQGQTLDRAFILANGLNRESGYTALSRGRFENRLYTVATRNEHDHGHTLTPDEIDELRRALATSSTQELATNYGRPDAPTRSTEPDLGMGL